MVRAPPDASTSDRNPIAAVRFGSANSVRTNSESATTVQLCADWACVADWAARNAATIIALAALLLTFWAGLSTRLNARMSALPLLHPFQQSTPTRIERMHVAPYVHGRLVAELRNGGLGPAIVTKYDAFLSGKLLDLSNKDLVGAALMGEFALKRAATWTFKHFNLEGAIAVPKDGEILCLELEFDVPKMEDYEKVIAGLERFGLRVEYQSMYGDELFYVAPCPLSLRGSATSASVSVLPKGYSPMRTPEGMAKETLRLVIEDCIRQGMHHYNISTGTFPQTIAVLLGRLEHRSGIQVPEVTVTVV